MEALSTATVVTLTKASDVRKAVALLAEQIDRIAKGTYQYENEISQALSLTEGLLKCFSVQCVEAANTSMKPLFDAISDVPVASITLMECRSRLGTSCVSIIDSVLQVRFNS